MVEEGDRNLENMYQCFKRNLKYGEEMVENNFQEYLKYSLRIKFY